jgi:predicted amidohydrolase YtcJ
MPSPWLLLAASLGASPSVQEPVETAEIILIGRVFTADPLQPWADAVAVRGDRILAVGTVAELKPFYGPSTRSLREPAGTVMPGFNDAHSHLLVSGALEPDLDLGSTTNGARVLEQVAGWLAAHPAPEPLNAVGLSASVAGGDPAFTARFEKTAAGRSVLLWGASTTWCLASAGARAELGLTPESALPRGVLWFPDRPDMSSALFVGPLLLETFAPIALGAPGDPGDIERRLAEACARANRVGITSIQEALPVVLVQALRAMAEKGTLTLRVHALTAAEGDPAPVPVEPFDPEDFDPAELASLPPAAPWITFGTLELEQQEKLLAGLSGLTPSALARLGDYRSRRTSVPLDGTEIRRTVEGTFHMAKDSIGVYASRGVVVGLSPSLLLTVVDSSPDELPWPEEEVMPLRSLLDQHVTVAFGTDYPLLPLDPLRGVYAAVSRSPSADLTVLRPPPPDPRRKGGRQGGRRSGTGSTTEERIYGPAERISILEALRAVTLDAAHAEGTEGSKGILAPGKVADLLLFEANLTDTQPRQLLQPHLRATIVGGRVVFGH